MSSNSTGTETCLPISSLSATFQPSINAIMIMHTFLTLYVPLVAALFYFSTPQSRRRPIFASNLAAIAIAFGNGVLIDAHGVNGILHPLEAWNGVRFSSAVLGALIPCFTTQVSIATGFLNVAQSIIVDFTLLIRLVSVYPPAYIGLVRFILLITIPVLLKLTRIINISVFTAAMVSAMNGPNASVEMAVVFTSRPYLKIEWAAQMIDNTYASVAFLWKMRQHGPVAVTTTTTRASVIDRMRTLFRIAASNFLIPTMFSIAQFVCAYRNVDALTLNQLVLANTAISTFGVAFATVWAGSVSQREMQGQETKRSYTTSRLMAIFGLQGSGSVANQSSTVMLGTSVSPPNSHEETKV